MEQGEYERVVMGLVAHGGDARSLVLEAIEAARAGDLAQADELMVQSREAFARAHAIQTDLIRREAAGEDPPVTLLMVHAQDHIMNASTVYDLGLHIIEMCRRDYVGSAGRESSGSQERGEG
jgi:PTS system cellobiose-specific IIA component